MLYIFNVVLLSDVAYSPVFAFLLRKQLTAYSPGSRQLTRLARDSLLASLETAYSPRSRQLTPLARDSLLASLETTHRSAKLTMHCYKWSWLTVAKRSIVRDNWRSYLKALCRFLIIANQSVCHSRLGYNPWLLVAGALPTEVELTDAPYNLVQIFKL